MMQTLPELNLERLDARAPDEMSRLEDAISRVGFLTLSGTGFSAQDITTVLQTYRAFFHLPEAQKADLDMARTGANRGWGRSGSEQVNPEANPDYKEFFDIGHSLTGQQAAAWQHLTVYAPNQWPPEPPAFRAILSDYYNRACVVAMRLLRAIAAASGRDAGAFDAAFDPPMTLLRGNFYPARPDGAGASDFGIAPHTDYGCLTLLATDGQPGLEVQMPGRDWLPVAVEPGRFVINFGEMLEIWSNGAIRATPHRVVGGAHERLSVPLFFNPSFDTNVAPAGAAPVAAGDHLSKRFEETYLHLKQP